MTIFILDNNLSQSAQYLDDKTLDRQIEEIAQVLCSMHQNRDNTWARWARECVPNYKWICEYGLACCEEYSYRQSIEKSEHPSQPFIEWAEYEVPFYYENAERLIVTEFPVTKFIDPEYYVYRAIIHDINKYITQNISWDARRTRKIDCIKTYRNYYRYILKNQKTINWTRRDKPKWLDLNNN